MELYTTKEQVNVTPADVAPEAQNLLSKQWRINPNRPFGLRRFLNDEEP